MRIVLHIFIDVHQLKYHHNGLASKIVFSFHRLLCKLRRLVRNTNYLQIEISIDEKLVICGQSLTSKMTIIEIKITSNFVLKKRAERYTDFIHIRLVFKNGPLFRLFSLFSNKQCNFLQQINVKNLSIQYTAPGFKPTTSWTCVVSHSRWTRASRTCYNEQRSNHKICQPLQRLFQKVFTNFT